MKTRMSWVGITLLVVAVPAWAHCGSCGKGVKVSKDKHSHSHAHAEVGKPAPDFTLKDVDGTEHKLSDLKGKIVVLEWINYQCPVVNRCHAAKTMSKALAKFKDKAVTWLAVDSSYFCADKVEDIRKWTGKQKVVYPYLLDANGKVGHIYGAKTTPHMFVIDKKGVLAYAGAVDNDPYGKEKNKRNYVEEAVTSLLNGSTVATASTKSYCCSVKYNR